MIEPDFPDKVTLNWLKKHVPMQFWFWLFGIFISLFLAGIYVGQLNLTRELIGQKNQGSQEIKTDLKTDLRLQFFGDRRIPQEVSSDNVASWFAYFSPSLSISPKDARGNTVAGGLEIPPNWAIFVALDKPARFRQAIVTFSNPEVMPVIDVHTANSRIIAISTRGQVPAGVLTIKTINVSE